MTIRDANNWCPTCEEACHHHPTHCTVCGTALEATPPPQENSNDANNPQDTVDMSPIPQHLRQETRDAAQELRQRLQSLRQRVQETGQQQQELLGLIQNMQQEWQTVPPGLMDPSQEGSSRSRPTSKTFLDQLPRIDLTEHSPWLYQATVKVKFPQTQSDKGMKEEEESNAEEDMEGILSDFDLPVPPQTQEGALIVAQPRTGLGGLSPQTEETIRQSKSNTGGAICLMERGDGVTFVEKALMAQKEGATACIIANNTDQPWPYVMKDSKGEAKKGPVLLSIPTVMIPKARAQKILAAASCKESSTPSLTCSLQISQAVHRDCVVCTDTLQKGSTVLRLPQCGHIFHESCVLQWLDKHNTCPFCRRELPTDDEEYERERRREQRTHAGSTGNQGSTGGGSSAAVNDFYS